MGKQKTMTLYERALEEGEMKGELKGEFKNKLETARKMINKRFSISEIQDITGLSEDELRENRIL